jgi:hypothetical protein
MPLDLRDGETYFRIDETAIEAGTHWLSARVAEPLPAAEIAALARSLRELQREDAGHIVFRSHSGAVELTFVMAKRGELHLSVRLQSAPEYLDEVRLFLNLRRDDLPMIVETLSVAQG